MCCEKIPPHLLSKKVAQLDAVASRGTHHADDFHNESSSGIRGHRSPDEPVSQQRLAAMQWGARPKAPAVVLRSRAAVVAERETPSAGSASSTGQDPPSGDRRDRRRRLH